MRRFGKNWKGVVQDSPDSSNNIYLTNLLDNDANLLNNYGDVGNMGTNVGNVDTDGGIRLPTSGSQA